MRVLVFCAIGLLIAATSRAETIRITNGEWPPFTSERLAHGGPLSRIVAEAFALEGVTVEYGYFPWKRSYEYAKSGRWDGSIGWEPNPRHLRDFVMSKPVILVDKALYHRKSTPFDWNDIDDLAPWRVGATAGYSYGEQWDQALRSGRLKVEEVALDEQNFKKLLMNRIDVVAMETAVADHLLRTRLSPEEASLVSRHPRSLAQMSICLSLSRRLEQSPRLLERFNRGLQRLKDSGRYDAYLAEFRLGSSSGAWPEPTAETGKRR